MTNETPEFIHRFEPGPDVAHPLLLLHGTRAVQMLVGIVVLVLAFALAWIAKLTMITYLLGLIFTYGAFAAVVVFQPRPAPSPVSALIGEK